MLNLPGDFTTGDFIVHNFAGVRSSPSPASGWSAHIAPAGTVPVQELCIGEPCSPWRLMATGAAGHYLDRPSLGRLQAPNPAIWCGRFAFVPGHSVPMRRVAVCLCRPITRFSWTMSLILVKYLINDASIERIPMDEVTYFHIELQEHSLSLAEDLPTESYLDTGDRSKVSNGAKQSTCSLISLPAWGRQPDARRWSSRARHSMPCVGASMADV